MKYDYYFLLISSGKILKKKQNFNLHRNFLRSPILLEALYTETPVQDWARRIAIVIGAVV